MTQVIECSDGRAMSADGENWELQLRVERPVGWGSLNRGRTEKGYCRYGVWSAEDGLASFPPPPQLDRQQSGETAAMLLEAIRTEGQGLPFPLTDTVECWLVDSRDGKPLVLLHSQEPTAELPARVSRRWCAALADADGLDPADIASLEAWVAAAALPAVLWVARLPAGGGQLLDARGQPTGRTLAPADFPELLLALPEPQASSVVFRYIEWLAPRLLMLPLSTKMRNELEITVTRAPCEMARFYPLYPAVANPKLMNALRVQAQLIAAA